MWSRSRSSKAIFSLSPSHSIHVMPCRDMTSFWKDILRQINISQNYWTVEIGGSCWSRLLGIVRSREEALVDCGAKGEGGEGRGEGANNSFPSTDLSFQQVVFFAFSFAFANTKCQAAPGLFLHYPKILGQYHWQVLKGVLLQFQKLVIHQKESEDKCELFITEVTSSFVFYWLQSSLTLESCPWR